MSLFNFLSRLFGVGGTFPDRDQRFNDRVEAAQEHVEKGEWQEGVAAITEVIRLRPDTGYYLFPERAYCYSRLGEYQKAISDWTQAMGFFSEDTPIKERIGMFTGRAIAFYNTGEYREALQDLGTARLIGVGTDFIDQQVFRYLGYAHRNLGEYPKAIEDFTEAIRLGPEDGNLFISRGEVYREMDKIQQGIDDCTEAIRLLPEDGGSYGSALGERAALYLSNEEYEKSIDDYREAIRIDPNRPDWWFARGYGYERIGNYHQAITDLSKSIELRPSDPDVFANRAWCYEQLDMLDEMAEDKAIEKALRDRI